MICLACGASSSGEVCGSCGVAFAVEPPHVRPSHVSQAAGVLADLREGRLGFEEGMARWGRFLDLCSGFQERWGVGLVGQLDPVLRPRFGEAVAELDAAWTSLEEAASHVSAWAEGGPVEHLSSAEAGLLDFFRRACGGCAWVEKELADSRGAGALLDVRSE